MVFLNCLSLLNWFVLSSSNASEVCIVVVVVVVVVVCRGVAVGVIHLDYSICDL